MDYQFKISTPSGELRRLRFKHEPTWREFKESLTSFIPGRSWEDYVVQYRDEEGDQIVVNTQPEWSEALVILAKEKIKKFSIVSKATKSVSSSSFPSNILTQDLNRANIEATLRQVIDQVLVSADSVVSQIPDLVDTFVEEIKKYQPTPVDSKPAASSSSTQPKAEEESKPKEEPLRFTPNVESSFLGELRAPSCRRFSPIHSRGSPVFRRAYPSAGPCEYSRLHDAGFRFLQDKNYASALECFQELVRLYPGNSIARYNLACTYSLLSTTKTENDEKEAAQQSALEALRQSIQIGYSNLRHMESDEDLDPIRLRPEYLRLVAQLKGIPFEEPSSSSPAVSEQPIVVETPVVIKPTIVDEPIFVIPTFEPIQEEIIKVEEPVPQPQPIPEPIPQPSNSDSELDSASRYSEEIKQLSDMGFFDAKRNLELLVRNDGDIFRVIAQLLD